MFIKNSLHSKQKTHPDDGEYKSQLLSVFLYCEFVSKMRVVKFSVDIFPYGIRIQAISICTRFGPNANPVIHQVATYCTFHKLGSVSGFVSPSCLAVSDTPDSGGISSVEFDSGAMSKPSDEAFTSSPTISCGDKFTTPDVPDGSCDKLPDEFCSHRITARGRFANKITT